MIYFARTVTVPGATVKRLAAIPPLPKTAQYLPRGLTDRTRRIAMTASIVTVGLTLVLNSFGLGRDSAHHHHYSQSYILPPGPGDGWGFPGDNPDKYGWTDYDVYLPLGADRTAEYYFPR